MNSPLLYSLTIKMSIKTYLRLTKVPSSSRRILLHLQRESAARKLRYHTLGPTAFAAHHGRGQGRLDPTQTSWSRPPKQQDIFIKSVDCVSLSHATRRNRSSAYLQDPGAPKRDGCLRNCCKRGYYDQDDTCRAGHVVKLMLWMLNVHIEFVLYL